MTKPFVDLESGTNGQLYPMMSESPELRWAFIRKVYSLIAIQFLLTSIVASVFVFYRPLALYMVTTVPGLAIYFLVVVFQLIIMCPLYAYRKRHPVNLVLLALFTLSISFSVGMSCAFVKGKLILEAMVLTSVITVSLTLYTFWGAKRGQDFSFLGPFLFAALMVTMVFALIQMLFPMGKLSLMILGLILAFIFCGFIVYDTNTLIKDFSYDEYVAATINIYLDIINLFLALLEILNAADG